MPRFFIERDRMSSGAVEIKGEDARHIALSLRMAVGDTLVLCDGEGYEYTASIESINPQCVLLSCGKGRQSFSEPPCFITLYQCIPKSDKFDTIIQKAVECGVSRIVPVRSSRCIAVVKGEKEEKRLERWNRIALEAAKQSGRGRVPKVMPPENIAVSAEKILASCVGFACYENEHGNMISDFLPVDKKPGDISFLIGPEGGLSEEEAALFRGHTCSLGNRILRTETASSFVLSSVSFLYEMSLKY